MVSGATALAEPPALFGGTASRAITDLLERAARAYASPNTAEAILWTAQALDPHCLPVYFALYKFYFYKGQLAAAERATRMALTESARQAGFDPDWQRATSASCDWSATLSPQHFYLFSLKALSFILLRQQRCRESEEILAKLEVLDPKDSVGASVIRDLARRAAA